MLQADTFYGGSIVHGFSEFPRYKFGGSISVYNSRTSLNIICLQTNLTNSTNLGALFVCNGTGSRTPPPSSCGRPIHMTPRREAPGGSVDLATATGGSRSHGGDLFCGRLVVGHPVTYNPNCWLYHPTYYTVLFTHCIL